MIPLSKYDRELVMNRFEAAVSAIAPGVRFPQEDGAGHAPIVSDLDGRVYSRLRSAARTSIEECPSVEVVHEYRGPTRYLPLDNDTYACEISVALFGLDRVADAGDSFDSTLRPALNALRSDLAIAALAVPFWPTPDSPEAMVNVLGRSCRLTLNSWWTDPAIETNEGYVVLDTTLRFTVNRHKL